MTSTLRQGYFDRLKLAAHVLEEGHQIGCKQTHILQFEPHSIYRKHGEVAYVLCMDNPIRQSSVGVSPMWL